MQEDYNFFLKNQTWDLLPLPFRRKIFSCRWVYRTKSIIDGQISRYKSKLVAKGFHQVHCIDYDDTFALVVKMNSIRLTHATAVDKGWEVHQMDVKNAFIQGDLSEEIYM
jgi:hypothetical protein